MARLLRAIPALTPALFAWLTIAGCGTEAVGIDGCRRIEQTRCRKALGCPELGIQGEKGVAECVQYARDRCLHGIAVADPGGTAIDACVSAIEQGTCDVIAAPDTAPACAFLRPVPVVDAGSDAAPDDASVTDAATDEGG